MVCIFKDHECRCGRQDKNCEFNNVTVQISHNQKPSISEIIDTAFEDTPTKAAKRVNKG